jgi:hypothetical protein
VPLRIYFSFSGTVLKFFLNFVKKYLKKNEKKTTDKLCITITNMNMDLYNNSAQLYLDGFLELTEDPEKYEHETLESYAGIRE